MVSIVQAAAGLAEEDAGELSAAWAATLLRSRVVFPCSSDRKGSAVTAIETVR